jgi:hypothetical protein
MHVAVALHHPLATMGSEITRSRTPLRQQMSHEMGGAGSRSHKQCGSG